MSRHLWKKLALAVPPVRKYYELYRSAVKERDRAIIERDRALALLEGDRDMSLANLYPKYLSIHLTTRCNLKCFICRRENFKGEDLHFENIYKLKNAIKHAMKIDLTPWGEVFLYKKYEDVLNYIYSLNKSKNLIQVTTNGTLLSESIGGLLNGHLDTCIISLNAAREETYKRDMKGGRFEDTLSRIEAFMSALEGDYKKWVRLHFVAHADNYLEIPDYIHLARKLGIVNVSIGNYMVALKEHIPYSLLSVREGYNTIIERAMNLGEEMGVSVYARKFFEESPSSACHCNVPVDFCYIYVDGKVVPCCYAHDHYMGNVYETSFEHVWFSEAYLKLREREYVMPACQGCNPIVSFDDCRAHFQPFLQNDVEFLGIAEQL